MLHGVVDVAYKRRSVGTREEEEEEEETEDNGEDDRKEGRGEKDCFLVARTSLSSPPLFRSLVVLFSPRGKAGLHTSEQNERERKSERKIGVRSLSRGAGRSTVARKPYISAQSKRSPPSFCLQRLFFSSHDYYSLCIPYLYLDSRGFAIYHYVYRLSLSLSLSLFLSPNVRELPTSRPRFPARPYIIPTAKICIPTIRICQDIATERTEWSLAGSRSDNESSPPFHLPSSLHRGVSRRHVALFLLFFLFVRSSYRASSPSDPLSPIRSANHSYQLPVFPNR